MLRRVLSLVVLFLLLAVIPVSATTGIDYLNKQDLTKDNPTNLKTLALIVETYGNAGNDISELKSKISPAAEKKKLPEQSYALLATGDSDLAEQIVTEQNHDGSWEDDVYTTALTSYALFKNNLEVSSADSGLAYLESKQKENGSWNNSVQDTAVSLLALLQGGYNGQVEQQALDWLLLQQGGSGSWGSNVNTAWATLALLEEGSNTEAVDEATSFLKLTINNDGGWGLYPGEKSDPFTSALVVQTLHNYDTSSSELTTGLSYLDSLINNQVWLTKAFSYYNLTEICYLLRDYSNSTIEEQYNNWLASFANQDNYDYLARQISVLSQEGTDTSELVNKLVDGQNRDGGWGFNEGYNSNPWATSLALRALLDAGYSNLNVYSKISYYLQNRQNSNGSFSITENGTGHIYLTTLIAEELSRLQDFVNCSTTLTAAKNWLVQQRDSSGSYGASLLETARAFDVTFEQLSRGEVQDSLDLFQNAKLANGSWENDSLTTAAVLSALEKIKADLRINYEDITFSSQEVYLNEQLTIKTKVHNRGYKAANDVQVRLKHGNIGNSSLVESKTVTTIPAGESELVSFTWLAEEVGSQIFNVTADQDDQIVELNEDNNLAAKAVNVVPKLDLTLSKEDIEFSPKQPGPNDELTITATIKNRGKIDSGAFKVTLHQGDSVLKTIECSGVTGDSSQEVTFAMQLPEGTHDISVSVDSQNEVEEDLEDNNTAAKTIAVAKRIDLKTTYEHLNFSNAQPVQGEKVTIYSTVINKGARDVEDVPVSFYLGNPAEDGTLLGKKVIDEITPNQSVIADYEWDTVGLTGEQSIYVVVDKENKVAEFDETNNRANKEITIEEMTNLRTSVINVDSSEFSTVKLGVRVSDQAGQGIENLDKDNFAITEGGTEQEISKLESEIDNSQSKAPVDLVFVIDTSGSMSDEWDYLPEIVNNLLDSVTEEGIDLQYKIYSLQGEPLSNINLPYEVLENGIFNGEFMNIGADSRHDEHWGPGTAWVAENYQWRSDAARIVIPISDEDCYEGSGSWWWGDNKEKDRKSIREATKLCQQNQVEAYPFYGFGDTSQTVKNRMDYLAQGTGGERFYFQDANQVVDYLSRVISEKKANYFIEYNTSNDIKDGTLRTVTVNTSYQNATGKGEGQYRAPQQVYSDLTVIDFTSEPIAHAEQSVPFNGVIENRGQAVANKIEVGFYLGDPAQGGILLATKQLGSLKAAEQQEVDFSWLTQAGTHNLYLVVDPEDKITESDENNNSRKLKKEVPGEQQPDLFITNKDVSLSTVKPYAGQNVKITAKVRNKGAGANSSLVSFYQGDPQNEGQLIATKKLDALSYLESQEIECSWPTGSIPTQQEIHVVVDPLNKIEEADEENNEAVKNVEIRERSLTGQIATDNSNYQPQQEAVIDLMVKNKQQRNWTGTAKVLIRDQQGQVIKELKSYQIEELSAVSNNQPGQWQNDFDWDIGDLSSGSYLACLDLYQNDDRFAEYVTEFNVLSDKDIDGDLLTDKQEYAPSQEAEITVDYTNSSLNTNLEDLDLKVTVSNSSGESIWTTETTIPYLVKSQQGEEAFYWPIENKPAGEYKITAEIKAGDLQLWFANKKVTVAEEVVLDGRLDIEPKQIQAGTAVDMSYKLQNNGNLALTDLPLKILLINETTEEVAKVVTRNHDLNVKEQLTDSLTEEINLADGRYMAVLQVEAQDEKISIANSGLIVDSTPPVTEYQLANSNPGRTEREVLGKLDSKLTLTAEDSLTGVEKIQYNLGEEYQEYKEAIEFSEEGKYQVKYKSVDKVGNQEQENNLTVIIDETTPETTVKTTGDKWSDGWFKTAPRVTLSAQDNLEGSGVDEIYYRYGKTGEVHKYSEPFTINEEGITELYVYAVDNNGNQETPYKTQIKFVKPWSAPYNLLVQELKNNGNVKVDQAFSNGAVTIKGNCQLNYLGTAQSEIDRRGNVTIESLATDLSYQSLPQPDWEALENITTLKTDKKIKDAVSNVKYKNNLKISGKGEVQGVLVVDGDLEISGKTRFPNTGIFCTGEVIISGNPEITGVIYAGDGLKMSGTPEVNGSLVVDGSATISGSVKSNQVKIKEYLDYLRKTDSEE